MGKMTYIYYDTLVHGFSDEPRWEETTLNAKLRGTSAHLEK